MQFHLKNLRELLESIKHNNLQYINIKQSNFELMVSKSTISASNYNIVAVADMSINNSHHMEEKKPRMSSSKQKVLTRRSESREPEIYFTIVSPMVGTFYRSPAPSEPYFIEIQDKVRTNQTVCIIEAMKLMNEIEAEVGGEIVEILVEDGEIVDSGQALMRIKPTTS